MRARPLAGSEICVRETKAFYVSMKEGGRNQHAKRIIPQIEAEVIPNAGHLLSKEQLEPVDAQLLKFLAKDSQPG